MLVDPCVNRVQLINMQLDSINFRKYSVKEAIKLHDSHLQATLMNINPKSLDFLSLENDRIESSLNELHVLFKGIKAAIFQLTK